MTVIYEDNHLIVVNKSASEIVQGDKTGDIPLSEMVKAYLKEKYQKPGNVFVGVTHRLDRPVSGLVIFAKTSKALERTKIRAFNANTYLARPSGQIGVIKNVVPLRPDSSAISTMIFNNHGIIEYRYDAKHKVQDWCSELTALAVPTRPRDMFYLHTK